MKIAKIVSSNSHIDYVGRVIDGLDVEEPPTAEDYGFAQFVSLPMENEEIVGVIYNSMLVNPEYASFGPRLSPKPELGSFSPDYLNEQGFLIGILLLGTKSADERILHGVPRRVVPAGQDVYKIDAAKVKRFHTDENECLQIHYYSQIVSHAGLFAVPLLESVIEQLSLDCSDSDRQRLGVLKQTLAWQRTLGGMRL
ncbi:MAG: hypothetical protein JWN60_335 [Acidobacteria bacterium]|jgi:hypothetical protein|nr:hypothetical protein [Acidobacteriota bacterium]